MTGFTDVAGRSAGGLPRFRQLPSGEDLKDVSYTPFFLCNRLPCEPGNLPENIFEVVDSEKMFKNCIFALKIAITSYRVYVVLL